MDYITIKRTRFKSISGFVNLPYGTVVQSDGNFIYLNGAPLCSNHSQNAYAFFTRNDDEQGKKRGKLTQDIIKILGKHDTNYQTRWDKVWADHVCNKYKRVEHADYWLWNHDFFNANLTDLWHIAALVGVNYKEIKDNDIY